MDTGQDAGNQQVVVEIWGDVVCPFCYMGHTLLTRAAEQFDGDVAVTFRSFQLSPELTPGVVADDLELMQKSYGISAAQAKAMNAGVAARAADIGLSCKLDTALSTNSAKAHQLIHFAMALGKQDLMVERLFRAYHTDNLHLGQTQVLAELAAEVGVDPDETRRVLDSEEYAADVVRDRDDAHRLGIGSVPYFVVNRAFAASGVQSVEALHELFHMAQRSAPESNGSGQALKTERVFPELRQRH